MVDCLPEYACTKTEQLHIIGFAVKIVIEQDDDQFHAFCPQLKGLHVGGRTQLEVLKNAEDGATLYLKSLIEHGDPIPDGISIET